MERHIEVAVYWVRMMCDKCKQGEMVATGLCYTSPPPQYKHTCNVCGNSQAYNKVYPTTEYLEAGDDYFDRQER